MLLNWQEHCDKLEDQKTYALQGNQWNPLSEHPKVRVVSLQRDSSFYTNLAQATTEMESLTQSKISAK